MNGIETWQVYGLGGELIAEYAQNGSPPSPQKEYGYRNGELLITADGRTNVALSANGGVASASTAHTCCGFSVGGAINGNITGPWGNGEGWNDATPNELPDWFQVDFAGSKTINEIDVFSLHDDYTQPNTPTETQTFSLYGLVNFEVQYWNGSAWATIPGGNVTGNNKVWRKFAFAPITTSKIRLWITGVPDAWSRLVELQAWQVGGSPAAGWGAPPPLTDNPLQVGVTVVKAQHITELRSAIDAVRSHMNLSAYSWQYSATTNDYISANPILEMRTALDQALGVGSYAAGLAQGQPVKAVHIQELRDRVLAAWQSGDGGSSFQIHWLVTDQLGTPRMVFDQTGSLANVSRHDYLPFGEELFAGTGGRTTAQGYSASDGVRNHFTGYERDSESGLDYAHARYYASMQGRFASPDPYVIQFEMKRGQDAEEEQEMLLEYLMQPQNWAKYNYGLNNPLIHTDPTGMRPPTRNEQNALNELDQLADKEGDTELGRGLRAARNEIAHIIDGLGRGQQDVGVNVAVNAILNIGNSQYANSATVTIRDNNGVGITIGSGNKCNILVAETYVKGAGLNWLKNGRGYPLVKGAAPAANWLGDAKDRQHLANIAIVRGDPRPGDIVAWRYTGGTQDGHSSIYIGGGVLVYAGSYDTGGVPKAQTLNYVSNKLEGYWGGHDTHVVRRYNGKP